MGLATAELRSALLAPTDLEIEDGEAVSILGPSGSGKSMLLRAIADLDPNEGEAWLDGVPRSGMSGPTWRRRVRYVAAEAAWWDDAVGTHFAAPDRTGEEATRLGMDPGCMTWPVARLSTGEKQRLGLLRALEDEPRVLLLDEPTAALDAASAAAVESIIEERLRSGAVVVLVTHDAEQAARLAGRSFMMESGRLSPARP